MSLAGLEVAQPPLGGLVGARYRLLQRIGAGGMATLYRARDERLKRDVAVKVIADRLANVPSAVRQFRREAQLGARLEHPNIVAILDAGAEPQEFIVMELVDGLDGVRLVQRDGRLMPAHCAYRRAGLPGVGARAQATRLPQRRLPTQRLISRGTPRPRSSTSELPPTRVTFAPLGRPPMGTPGYPPGDPQGRQAVSPIGSVRARCGRASVPARTEATPRPSVTGDTTPLATAAPRLYPLAELRPSLPRRFSAAVDHALAVDPDARQQSVAEFLAQLLGTPTAQPAELTPPRSAYRA